MSGANEFSRGLVVPETNGPGEVLKTVDHQWTSVQKMALHLAGKGLKAPEIARKLAKFQYPPRKYPDRKLAMKNMRRLTRIWLHEPWFLDALWDQTVKNLDLETPKILEGVAKSAKKGKIDAAKLALAVAGRYTEKENQGATNIAVVFGELPRPDRTKSVVEGRIVKDDG